jgi:ornithine cyclodeaminase/alanine dehydrogenase-like protein (mu-crystallin family)
MDEGRVRYLSAADVRAAMPAVDERLALAERAMTALVADAELPPKIGVHPRPPGSFAHAMPASLRPTGAGGPERDLLGVKWVTGFAANRASGLPAIHAVVLVSDPATGAPVAILDGGPITAERTAAVSGVAIARFGPSAEHRADRPVQAAVVGAGVQGRSHLAVLGHLLPGVRVAVHDRHADRAAALAATAIDTPGIGSATTVRGVHDAIGEADIVITAASFTDPAHRQALDDASFAPEALVIAVDYATMCAASVALTASRFVVDERAQFLANRDAGQFDGYPDPATTLGEAVLADETRPPHGRVLVTHLGVGLADVVFADAILRAARRDALGVLLPR